MAITGTDRGTGGQGTGFVSSVTMSPSGNFAAGSWAVLAVAIDNSNTNGVAHSTFAVTDSLGNTWTRRVSALQDPAGANVGVEGGIWTTDQAAGTLTTSTVITVSWGPNTALAQALSLIEVAPTSGYVLSYANSGTNTGASTSTPTVTTASITSGNLVIGALFVENGAVTITGDSDTSNGSWSTQQKQQYGAGTNGVGVSTQRKVVTGTATQTYNPTLSAAQDCVLGWLELTEALATTTLTANPLEVTVSLPTAFIAASGSVSLSASALAVTASLPTATLAASGSVSLAADPLEVGASLPEATLSVGGAATLAADPLEVSVSLPEATLYAAPLVLAADPLEVGASLPEATLYAAPLVLAADPLEVAVSLPEAALFAAPLTLVADPLEVFVSLPEVSLLEIGGPQVLVAAPLEVLLSLPAATLVPGSAVLLASALEVAVSLPAAALLRRTYVEVALVARRSLTLDGLCASELSAVSSFLLEA